MTASKTVHDKDAEKKADDAKVAERGSGKDFGDDYKPLDPSSGEKDPATKAGDKKEEDKGVKVDTSASVRTSDSDDPSRSWTIQKTSDDDVEHPNTTKYEPGQKFRWEELPHAESVEAWGVSSEKWPEAYPLHEDDKDKGKKSKK